MHGINIWSGSRELKGLGAALTNPTELSFHKGSIIRHYPVEFRGVVYPDAEAAYQRNKSMGGDNLALMAQIICAKLLQHPLLLQVVDKVGGLTFLEQCEHKTWARTERFQWWEGKGYDSPFIRTLIEGYKMAKAQTP